MLLSYCMVNFISEYDWFMAKYMSYLIIVHTVLYYIIYIHIHIIPAIIY